MKAKIFSAKDYLTTSWSGGETTQMYIYPPNAKYAKRNFDLRISSATVNVDKSEFTDLKGIDRILMSLNNTLILQHNDGAKIKLEPLEAHAFSGDDFTVSYGKCQDFNVMLKRGVYKKAQVFVNEAAEFDLYSDDSECFLYAYKGNYAISVDQNYDLQAGELMWLKDFPYGKIQRKEINSVMIVVKLN